MSTVPPTHRVQQQSRVACNQDGEELKKLRESTVLFTCFVFMERRFKRVIICTVKILMEWAISDTIVKYVVV